MSAQPDNESVTVTASGLASRFIKACPSFQTVWADIADDPIHVEDDGDRLHYLDAGEFVRHLAQLESVGQRGEFAAVFQLIEELVTNGDPYVQELAVIGILEGFQMASVTKLGIDPELAFRPLVGPESEQWWARINNFWDGDHTALQERN